MEKIKNKYVVKGLLLLCLTVLLNVKLVAQPSNDVCSNALDLCPQTSFSASNIGATQTNYQYGEDDFNFCFAPKKTIWFKFKTNNNGGKATINLGNITFTTSPVEGINFALIKPQFPCDGSTYVNDTCIANIQNNSAITVDSLDSLTTYYICLSGVDVGSVISEFSLTLNISGQAVNRPTPTLSIYPSKSVLCENDEVILMANLQNCPNSSKYRWYRNGQLFATSDSSFIYASNIQNGDVISVENNCFNDCIDTLRTDTNPFTVNTIVIQVSNETTIKSGDRALLECYTPVDSIWWQPSYLAQTPNEQQTYVDPKKTTTFYANVLVGSCVISTPILVNVLDNLKIYNTFSPNNDGINDTWTIEGIEKYPNSEVSIFTRWGQRVFFILGYNNEKAWDGTSNGKKLESGTYFYTIDLKDPTNAEIIKGALNLIR